MRQRVDILGVGIDAVDLGAAAERVERALRERRRLFVITANPEFVMLARRSPRVRAAAESADLIVPDGTGLVIAAALLGRALPGRARGRELVQLVAAAAAGQGRSLFLLGARDGVAARAAEALRRANPELRVAGAHPGNPEEGADGEVRSLVASASPDVLLVAYGMPKQELWLWRNLSNLESVCVAIGVGGAFDYLAGESPLPPRWLARIGLEWLWRLLRQPWRWRRQLAIPAFLALVVRERFRTA